MSSRTVCIILWLYINAENFWLLRGYHNINMSTWSPQSKLFRGRKRRSVKVFLCYLFISVVVSDPQLKSKKLRHFKISEVAFNYLATWANCRCYHGQTLHMVVVKSNLSSKNISFTQLSTQCLLKCFLPIFNSFYLQMTRLSRIWFKQKIFRKLTKETESLFNLFLICLHSQFE